ncbi:MAG: DNA polymerase III subunit delta [Deltaproteobacteria bacterium]|nr:DNA polymerase III subunit delta [Deltaproteobacteria bacterium]
MKIPEVEKLREYVEAGNPLPVVLLAGGDDAVRDGVESLLRADLAKTGAAVSVVRLDAGPARSDAWERVASMTGNTPMFGEAFVIAVSNCDAAKEPPELAAFLDSPAPHVRLALYGDRKAARSGLGKAIAKVGKVVTPKDVRQREAVRLVWDAAREVGLHLEGGTAMALVDLVGGDRGAIRTAINSLLEYRGRGGSVSEKDIRGLVTRTSKPAPWDLDDAIAARDLGRCIKVAMRNLEDTGRPAMVLNAVVRMVRRMLIAKDLMDKKASDEEAMDRLKISHPFPLKRIREASARYGRRELERFLKDVPRLEILVKRNDKSAGSVLTSALASLITKR